MRAGWNAPPQYGRRFPKLGMRGGTFAACAMPKVACCIILSDTFGTHAFYSPDFGERIRRETDTIEGWLAYGAASVPPRPIPDAGQGTLGCHDCVMCTGWVAMRDLLPQTLPGIEKAPRWQGCFSSKSLFCLVEPDGIEPSTS